MAFGAGAAHTSRGVLLTASECCLHLLCPQVAESPEAMDTPACLLSPAPPIQSPGLFWLPLRSKVAPKAHSPPADGPGETGSQVARRLFSTVKDDSWLKPLFVFSPGIQRALSFIIPFSGWWYGDSCIFCTNVLIDKQFKIFSSLT